ncbi:hypothetical protein HOLleu_06148 [Holothuria leucospilota]|uniref:Uncharacterized protein n=1 Tax=Holothuria leucospilota TaxID=206669 RepID=A0A9Q1CKI2_HOLLE|nr:hypothetical protein HOLleu_06148 [Holothuria leucospilota]
MILTLCGTNDGNFFALNAVPVLIDGSVGWSGGRAEGRQVAGLDLLVLVSGFIRVSVPYKPLYIVVIVPLNHRLPPPPFRGSTSMPLPRKLQVALISSFV